MKISGKAIFLSALVLPGLGQITLKRYKTGIVILLTVVISISRMMSAAMDQANAIVNNLVMQGGALDISTIANAATQATGSTDNATYNLYLWLIIACWLISIIDVLMAGKKSV